MLHALWIGDRNLRRGSPAGVDPLPRAAPPAPAATPAAVPLPSAPCQPPPLATVVHRSPRRIWMCSNRRPPRRTLTPQVAVARADGAVLLTPAQVSGGAPPPRRPLRRAAPRRDAGSAPPGQPTSSSAQRALPSGQRACTRTCASCPPGSAPGSAAGPAKLTRAAVGTRSAPRGRGTAKVNGIPAGAPVPAARRAGAVVAPAVDHLDRDRQFRRARFNYRSGRRQPDGCPADLAAGLTGLDLDAVRLSGEKPAQRERQQRVAVVGGGGHSRRRPLPAASPSRSRSPARRRCRTARPFRGRSPGCSAGPGAARTSMPSGNSLRNRTFSR